ncbi:hypothetical protein X943_004062 [Babesia divergens]|uniref:Uncharacterized protein n=1 Tax=Babesia divergens TaxID=32595 RepID=A0AAD9LLW8_BABDI|nr:hypothetical protein X943_004062 [Babesia divergens]
MVWLLWLGVLHLAGNALSKVLQSESATIEAMCDNIVYSATLLNKSELLKLVDMTHCKDYALLGEAVLMTSERKNNYCYGRVAPILCGSKYTTVKSHLNCEHIKKKFMTIMNGCLAEETSQEQDKNCSGLNVETFAITDPLVFCKMNFVSSEAGDQVSFKHNELDDCQALAKSYNHCQTIGKAFNHPRFCIDGGYQEIHDDAYIDLCKNVVLPFVFSKLWATLRSPSSSFCRNADDDIEKGILTKRDDLMNRSQELLDTVDSEFAFKTWKHDMETKTRTVAENLQQVIKSSDTSISNTYNIFRLPYNFDPLVRSEFAKGLDHCTEMMQHVTALPREIKNMTFLIENIDPLMHLDLKIQEALIHFKQFNSLLASGSHSTIIPTEYYKPVDPTIIKKIRSTLSELKTILTQRLAAVTTFLGTQTEDPPSQDRERSIRDAANELKFIASLHESQLTSFLKGRGKRIGKAFSHSTTV